MIEGDGTAAQLDEVMEDKAAVGGQKLQPTHELFETDEDSTLALMEMPFSGESPPSPQNEVSTTTSRTSRKESVRKEEMAVASPRKKKKKSSVPVLEDPTMACHSLSPGPPPALGPASAPAASSAAGGTSPSCSVSTSSGSHESPSSAKSPSCSGSTSSGSHEPPSSAKRARWEKNLEKSQKHPKKEKKLVDHPQPLPRFKWPQSNQTEHDVVDLEDQFHHFLLGCKEALIDQLSTNSLLAIDFMELLSRNKDLAVLICNEESRWCESWLTPAIKSFATQNGWAARRISPYFINKPERIYAAKELLSENTLTLLKSIFRGARKQKTLIATPHLQMLLAAILWGILGEFEKGISWQGKLTLDDIFFIKLSGRLQLIILKDPEVQGTATPDDGLLDVKSVWPMIEAFVVSSDGALPLYFEQLKDDLAGATAAEFNEPWFREYLRYSQALASSTERKDLAVGLQHNSKTFRSSKKKESQFENFMKKPPAGADSDWRSFVREDEILKRTFHYKTDRMKEGTTHEKPASVVVVQKKEKVIEAGVDAELKEEENETIVFNHPVSVMVQEKNPDDVVPDTYFNTTRSMLDFNRNSVTHTDEHITVADLEDVEIYGATKYEWFLPHVVKGFLRINQMKGKLFGTWSTYTASIRGRLLCPFC